MDTNTQSLATVPAQPSLASELRRCREVVAQLQRHDENTRQASVLTQIGHQLFELQLRLSRFDAAPGALLAALAPLRQELAPAARRDVLEQLESLLICSDDDQQISSRLERERVCDAPAGNGAELTWSDQFRRSEVDGLCAAFGAAAERGSGVDDAIRSRARARLRTLITARFQHDRELCNDARMRMRMLRWITLLMVGLLALLTELCRRIAWGHGDEAVAAITALIAGGIGASLSSCYKLHEQPQSREELQRFSHRQSWGQAAFGLVAGLFVFTAVNSGLVGIAGFNPGQISWYQAATLGFLSGFSEPFFIGQVKRLSMAARASKDKEGASNAEPTARLRQLSGARAT